MLMDKPEEVTAALGGACGSQVCGSQDVWVFPKDQMWIHPENMSGTIFSASAQQAPSPAQQRSPADGIHTDQGDYERTGGHIKDTGGERFPEIEGIFLKNIFISEEPTKGPPREKINSKHSRHKRQLSCDAACQSKFSCTPSCPAHSSPKARCKSYWVSKGNVSNPSPFSL